jgi:hypothetical protein
VPMRSLYVALRASTAARAFLNQNRPPIPDSTMTVHEIIMIELIAASEFGESILPLLVRCAEIILDAHRFKEVDHRLGFIFTCIVSHYQD